jgi:hypothetical protein
MNKLLDSRLLRQRPETFLNFPRGGGLEVCGAVYQRSSRSRSARRSALSSVFTTERTMRLTASRASATTSSNFASDRAPRLRA